MRNSFIYLTAIAGLLVGQTIVLAEDAAADPSFSSTSDLSSPTPSPNFGTLRQFQPTNPITLNVYNRQVATPQSAMTYVPSKTTSIGSPGITLQNIALDHIAAGGQGSLQVALSTSQPGSSAIYQIYFSSDTTPSPQGDKGPFTIYAFATVLPAGDFNNDRSVDARDYVVWRKTENSNVTPWTLGDSNGDGRVDNADYANYRKNFGYSLPASAAELGGAAVVDSAGVPEPCSALCALLTIGAGSLLRRTRSPRRR